LAHDRVGAAIDVEIEREFRADGRCKDRVGHEMGVGIYGGWDPMGRQGRGALAGDGQGQKLGRAPTVSPGNQAGRAGGCGVRRCHACKPGDEENETQQGPKTVIVTAVSVRHLLSSFV
jgi:hypothetical protein